MTSRRELHGGGIARCHGWRPRKDALLTDSHICNSIRTNKSKQNMQGERVSRDCRPSGLFFSFVGRADCAFQRSLVFLANSMLVVKTILINCHNYCDHFRPNVQPDGRIWCHICDPIINLARGPSEHIVPFAAFTICPQVVRVLFFWSCEFIFDYIRV